MNLYLQLSGATSKSFVYSIRVKFNVMDSLHPNELDNDEIDELNVDEDYLVRMFFYRTIK